MMNQRSNDGINVENYFNNNGRGFNNPHVIEINDLNIKIEVYSNNLRATKAITVEKEIIDTVNSFKNSFGLNNGESEQILKIYIFNDKEDYTNLGGSENFNFGLGDEGGKCYYRGTSDVFANMYVYQQGRVHNLQHELAHGLTYLATGGESLPTVLMEGIADYFEHHSSHKFNSQGSSIDVAKDRNLSLNQILNLEYSPNGEDNSLVYKTGHALVMCLQEKYPNLLSDYLSAIRAGNSSESQNFLNQITQHNDGFKDWLAKNNTDVAMKDINALQVTKGEYIATKKEVVSGEIKDVSYYKANIEKIDGEKVGSFSPVDHISFYDVIRATNKATGNLLDISKGEYGFLKVVSTTDGNKLTYSDKHGNEYQDSKEYKQQALRILSKHGEDLEESYRIKKENLENKHNEESKKLDQLKDKEYDGVLKGLAGQKDAQLRDVSEKLSARKISYEEYLKEDNSINTNYHSEDQKRYSATEAKYAKLKSDLQNKYEKERNSLLDEVIKDGLKQVKETKNIDVEKILEGLITLDTSSIRSTSDIDLREGKIFSLKALGQGITGGLSIYDGDTKLGELLSETGLFKRVEGSNKESFFFQDVLHNMHVKYDGGAYMAVTKENGQYKASFVDGRKVNSDEYYREPHLHENELLNPSINHIKEKNLDSLLLKDTKILNHKDSELAQYSDDQKENGIIIEKGKLLDDKGTDRTDDDVHAAVVKQEGKDLHEFKNMGFYITEEVKNSKGDVIDKSDLFIHDHGKNVRFQLPNDINHLKLVKKNGEHKLVPSTKDGNEHPEGMPNIPDEYRYIDPIFAHEYEKRDYSHKHVNIGLINLDKYKPGTLFSIKHDPNDYHIQRNSAGEIVRMNDNAYFTKVKLFHDDKEIGMLSNNFHNFKDKIFFSADYNYSYNDFLASVSPRVEVENMNDGSKKITFDQSVGDVGNTNRGYTDHQRIFVKNNELTQEKNQEPSDEENSNSKTIKQSNSGVRNSNTQESGDFFSKMSNAQSSDRREDLRKDNQEKEVPLERVRRSSGEEDEMQSDQPMDAKFVKGVKHQQKDIDLKASFNKGYAYLNHEKDQEIKIDPVKQQLMHKLFPNQENIEINDNLIIEVKYGDVVSYTPDYIKQSVQKAYEAWCDNFYPQKHNNGDGNVIKLQLYVFKNNDDYKKYIKKVSGKDKDELYGGGTVSTHEADGTVAKTFIIGDMQGLSCAKSKYIMEKMSDAFLEYATSNIDQVPKILREGMKLFMWSYDVDKKESINDMHYTKEAYVKMKEMGCDTPNKIASFATDFRIIDCLVTFLQEKHPSIIPELISKANSINIKTALIKSLSGPKIEKEFKEWMDKASGSEIITKLVPNNSPMSFAEHKIEIDIKYDKTVLNESKLSYIKDTIQSTIGDFNSSFGINNSQPWHNIPNKVNVFIFNNKPHYEDYLRKLNIFDKESGGLAIQGRGSDVHVHLYVQDSISELCKVLKHELGHALTMINSYWGTSENVPKAMHEGLANYIAGLEGGTHKNDHGDKKALSEIAKKALKADEILSSNYKGSHYYSEAEQVIKFLENKHPDLIDNLLKTLSRSGATRTEGNELIKKFMQDVKSHNAEFKEWVSDQLNNQNSMNSNKYDATAKGLLDDTEMQHDQPSKTMNKDILNDQNYHYKHTVEKRSLDDTKIQHQPLVKVLHDEQKTIILKNTILKIEKSHDQDSQGRHKADVIISRKDIESLYNNAEGEEQQYILKFWHKLHKSEYKVGTLPEGKYYFSKGKFFIHDNQEKKMIVLPEDKISVKIMKSVDSYKLVISNDKDGVINSVDKIDNLNYDLLSDFSNINLETEGSIKLADQHMEYDSYLINGLDGKILNNHDNGHDYYNDHSLI